MKVVMKDVPAGSRFKTGEHLDLTGQELDVLTGAGHVWVTESEFKAEERVKATQTATLGNMKALIVKAVNQAVEREALVPKGDGESSAEKVQARAFEQLERGNDLELIVGVIDGIPGKAQRDLAQRLTTSTGNGVPFQSLTVTGTDIKDATNGYVKAMEHQDALCKSNKWKDALAQSKEAAIILKMHHLKADDLLMTDAVRGATRFDPNTVRAATFSDPNSQVGSLAGDLVILRNLGFLKNKLAWSKFLTTDMSGEPVQFGQQVLTRYITVPDVLTWVPGVGFTKQAQQIADSGTGTTQSAGQTIRVGGGGALEPDSANAYGIAQKSSPTTTDVGVILNMFKAVEVEFPVSMLAGTMRNLFAEQYSAQLYGLAEAINQHVLAGLFAATKADETAGTWGTGGVSGLSYSYTKGLANWNLAGMIGVKNRMTLAKIPDVGRFALLHSFYHDKLLEDSNLLSAKAILSLIKKDAGSFEDGEVPTLFGVKPLESQLASATNAGVLTSWVDDTNLGTTNIVGFAGNMSAYLFVSRPPQDWTSTLTKLGIPSTASVRLVTEPDSGLTVMVFSYADNGRMSMSQRVCLMWGRALGDPRCGILIKAA